MEGDGWNLKKSCKKLHSDARTAVTFVLVSPQRYGLWDQEGPLEENTPPSEDGLDKERRGREKEEAGRASDEDFFQRGVENKDTNESHWTDQPGPVLVQTEKACTVFLKRQVTQDDGDSERLLYCILS